MKPLLCLLLLACTAAAPAAVVYSGLQNIPIPTTFNGIYVDADNAATSGAEFLGWDFNFFFGGYGMANSAAFQPLRASVSNDSAVLNLPVGTLIDGTSNFFSTGDGGSGDVGNEHLGLGASQFQDGVPGYLGFRFTKNDSSGPYYGWMQVTLTANTPGGIIHEWYWEDSGLGIMIPEPSRALLLMFGMALALMRRRRRS